MKTGLRPRSTLISKRPRGAKPSMILLRQFAAQPGRTSSDGEVQAASATLPQSARVDDGNDEEVAISNVTIRGNQLHGETTNRGAIEHSPTITATRLCRRWLDCRHWRSCGGQHEAGANQDRSRF